MSKEDKGSGRAQHREKASLGQQSLGMGTGQGSIVCVCKIKTRYRHTHVAM